MLKHSFHFAFMGAAPLYANNRGIQVAAFTDFEETVNWLTSSTELTESA